MGLHLHFWKDGGGGGGGGLEPPQPPCFLHQCNVPATISMNLLCDTIKINKSSRSEIKALW